MNQQLTTSPITELIVYLSFHVESLVALHLADVYSVYAYGEKKNCKNINQQNILNIFIKWPKI